MSLPPGLAEAQHFHDLVLTGEPPSLPTLLRALDALVLGVQDSDDLCPTTDDHDPPRQEYEVLCAAIRARFPSLGYYAASDPLTLPAKPMTGDAIDDLADIVTDLAEALWLFQHSCHADGVWSLRLSFMTHWGDHARSLAVYLHAKQYD